MSPCSVTRPLVAGFVVGVGVSTLTGNDVLAAFFGVMALAAAIVLGRSRRFGGTCTISPADDSTDDSPSGQHVHGGSTT